MNDNMSPADVAAVVGNTDRNNGYAYPVFPYGYGSGFGGNGFAGDGGWIWLILILALFGGWGNNGNGAFGGFNNDYAWLSNGQKEIMQNTNQGFDTLHLSNQIEGTRDGIYGLSNQICNSTADVTSAITNGFYGAEISANNRAVNQMQDNWALSRQLADCCCENRLGIANLNSTILSENCADRYEAQKNTQSIITNATANTQAILDKLCQLELDGVKAQLDAKNDKISDLQRENLMKDLQASQIQQTADLRFSNAEAVDSLYTRLSNCPVPSTPVYGRTPIFTCNSNSGCGCGNTFGNTIV